MHFKDYEDRASVTAIYPNKGEENYAYPTLGLCGETGEVAEKVKKYYRDGVQDKEEWKNNLKKELGDCLWYIAALCNELGFSMEDVAKANIEKLKSRQERGQLQGSGDNR